MRYLAFVPVAYAFDIMRPLQAEARRRGDDFAWYVAHDLAAGLKSGERRLADHAAVREFSPDAVFSAVYWVPYMFPGIKVMLFHGFDTNKRNNNEHFNVRGWYDLLLTQGPSTTGRFNEMAAKAGYFAVRETGWANLDPLFDDSVAPRDRPRDRPVILFASTFSRRACSIPTLGPTVQELIRKHDWHWLLSTHPKTRAEWVEQLARMAGPNAEFVAREPLTPVLKAADIVVGDTSSLIFQFQLQRKPAVTFRNAMPGPHLIDIQRPEDLEAAIERALSRPAPLMRAIDQYCDYLNPYRDGQSARRGLDAVEQHLRTFRPRTRKPMNLWRKLEVRARLRKMERTRG